MPDSIVLIDFGATRIKSVCWSLTRAAVVDRHECRAPPLSRGPHGEMEGSPEAYWRAFEATAGELLSRHAEVSDLWICSEMHGFMVADPRIPSALTPYISWQDQRVCHRPNGQSTTFESFAHIAPDVLAEAGLVLRPGLPILTLAHIRGCQGFPKGARFLTLVDWLLVRGGEAAPQCNITLASGTGLCCLADQAWSRKLLGLIGIGPSDMQMPIVAEELRRPIGLIKLNGREVRVWGGIGDLQAAAFGAGFPEASPIFVNLGTGSQVLIAMDEISQGMEFRRCALGELAYAVTHIPSGRAINTFAEFVDGCSRLGGGQPIFWKNFTKLTSKEVLDTDTNIDLNVFAAAWRFDEGGRISRITEGAFDLGWLMRSIARSWLSQYAEALARVCDIHYGASFLLGGGLSRRGVFIGEVLESILGRKCILCQPRTGEETLDGLLRLAEISLRD